MDSKNKKLNRARRYLEHERPMDSEAGRLGALRRVRPRGERADASPLGGAAKVRRRVPKARPGEEF